MISHSSSNTLTSSSNSQHTARSRIRQRSNASTFARSGICTAVCIVALLSAVSWSFQPQQHQQRIHRHSTSFSAPLPSIPSSSSKRSSQHYVALQHGDLSTKSRSSRLSLSSIAVPSSGTFPLVNNGSDYYSWVSSGWDQAFSNSNENMFAPSKQLEQQQTSGIAPVKALSQSEEYQRRKDEWAKRYTCLNGLRKAFGSNRNKLWGDLDPATTRKLYKSLLPNALCELVLELGVEPEELAPLAYQARKAAKLYARERCQVPARIAANLFDGFRQWRRYGRFQPSGISYEQLWDKYYHQQLEEVGTQLHAFRNNDDDDCGDDELCLQLDDTVTEEEIVSQTCQKILEKACTTNEMVDRMVLSAKKDRGEDVTRKNHNDLLLKRISRTLQRDVRKLLDPARINDDAVVGTSQRRRSMTPQEYHALKLFALSQRQLEDQQSLAASR